MAVLLDSVSAVVVRLKQLVQVHNNIFHLGIIDGALRSSLPGGFCLGVSGKDANHVEGCQILEVQPLRVFHAAAENKMEKGFLSVGHSWVLLPGIGCAGLAVSCCGLATRCGGLE